MAYVGILIATAIQNPSTTSATTATTMKKIKLTQRKYALIDDDDYEAISKRKWFARKTGGTYYALTDVTYMHRVILQAKKGDMIDHINGNGLDNRKSNLRFTDKSLNGHNTRAKRRRTTLGVQYKFHPDGSIKNKPFWAYFVHQRKQISIGYYKTKLGARRAYLSTLRKYGV